MSRAASFFREGRSGHARRGHLDPPREPGIAVRVSNTSPSTESSAESAIHVFNYGSVDKNSTKPTTAGQPAATPAADESKPDLKNVLTVVSVDILTTTNGLNHHTDKYAITQPSIASPKLVVRRGQPFNIKIEFSKPYDQKVDDLKLVFEAGNKPLPSKRTYVEFILSEDDKPGQWGAKLLYSQGNTVTVEIHTPPTCYVAKWVFKVDVVKRADEDVSIFRYVHKDPFYIIFNPWCKDDAVYMPEEKLLSEYILNEIGKLYCGTQNSISSKPWNYGQFESCVLEVAMYLLDMTDLNWSVRGNVIPIVRKLSALINSSDDGGVLTGNWSGDYEDGTSPLTWTGSVQILEEYWKTKRPVRYGQCWVFAGVLATVCQALGIPTRCVTNFSSAHDTDGSITIDIHMKANGELDTDKNDDSIWTFHVWNECWMARPDLPHGYGGWQVVDATPQEASDGVFCCGPTSVIAIQNGEVNLPYDGQFVFAEINADKAYWYPNANGVFECNYINKNGVGHFISTKACNSNDREDITSGYKFPEGSPEERAAVLRANQVGSTRHDIYKIKANDVKFTIVQDADNSWLGASFVVELKMKNTSKQKRTVSGRICVGSMYYTGVYGEKLKSEPFKTYLKADEERTQTLTVTQNEYDRKLKDGYLLDVSVCAQVKETDQIYTRKEDSRLRKPHLTTKAPAEVTVGKEFKIDVSFANPLNKSLTGCVVSVDGIGKAIKFPQGNVSPNGTFVASLPITPEKAGNNELIIIFNSVQLEDIHSMCPITVKKAEQ